MKAYVNRRILLSSIVVVSLCFTALFMYVIPSNDQIELRRGNSIDSAETSQVIQRIESLLTEIDALKRNNAEMRNLLAKGASAGSQLGYVESNKLVPDNYEVGRNPGDPSDAYEKTRRALELDLKELWYTIRSKDKEVNEQDMAQMQDVYRVLRSHLIKLRAVDGYEAFRKRETEELSNIIQERLRGLQNPKNCDTAMKLVCSLNKGCGFGCQVHHLCYCLITAYATGRTLILESKGWRYNRQGWEQVFKPVSDTCTVSGNSPRLDWSSKDADNTLVLSLPIVDFLKPKPDFLPIAIPADIADRLEKVHGEPHIWWVGQFMKYLLRPQPSIEAMLAETVDKLGITSPTVGIHVRRTDKIGTEAALHSLKEYMVHAEEYFAIMEKVHGTVKKRVFIASDEPTVITEAQTAYPAPEWEIMGDKSVAQSASMSQRYNNAGLNGILKDIFMLAECDFLICTFSSQVCRLAYEIMQSKYPDASERFVSLDDVYYYGGGNGLTHIATVNHEPRNDNEIEVKAGDKIGVAGNHWNGMSKGTNQRTGRKGLYPSYKARTSLQRVNFPLQKWWIATN